MMETTSAPARNYVGGEWREASSDATYEKRSPWRPEEVTGTFQASDADDAAAAVEAAAAAAPAWAALPAPARGAFLVKAADALEARVEQVARDMTAEMGKPLREARLEAARAARRSSASPPARRGVRSARCTRPRCRSSASTPSVARSASSR